LILDRRQCPNTFGFGARRLRPVWHVSWSGCVSDVITDRTGECASSVRVDAYFDDLGIVDDEDLVEQFGRSWPRPIGLAAHIETEHDSVAVDLRAFDGGPSAVGEEASEPIEDLAAVGADASPLDLGVQERSQQLEVEAAVSGVEMSGHIGHHPGAECGGWAVLVRIGLGPLVWGDGRCGREGR
jgi:hypothetical protein